jgi:alpha-L-fucosidase
VRSDGTIDPTEMRIVKEIGAWLKVNGESIYGTRPWTVCGEGPAMETKNAIQEQGFNEGKVKLTASDIRFTKKGNALYVTLLGKPETDILVKSLAKKGLLKAKIKRVELLGSQARVAWRQASDGLHITCPTSMPRPEAVVFKVVTSKKL